MPQAPQVNLTDEELGIILKAGELTPEREQRLDSDTRRRLVKAKGATTPTTEPAIRASTPKELRYDTSGVPMDAVTVGDIIANPSDAMQRIGGLMMTDATDPKTWLQLAGAYFVPKVFNKVAPVVVNAMKTATSRSSLGNALSTAGRYAQESPSLIKMAGRGVEKVGQAITPAAAGPVEPVAASPVAPAPPVAPAAPGARPAPPAEPEPSAPQMTQKQLNEEAIARRRAEYQAKQAPPAAEAPAGPAKFVPTRQEMFEYMRMLRSGKTPAEAGRVILAQRAFAERFGTPTTIDPTFPKGMRGKVPPQGVP